ncbi:HAD hydrolase-like protein [Chloroflexota bacterium]
MPRSWMIDDRLTDIEAGNSAGTRTLLLGRNNCMLCHLMGNEDACPDAIADNLGEAVEFILKSATTGAGRRREAMPQYFGKADGWRKP